MVDTSATVTQLPFAASKALDFVGEGFVTFSPVQANLVLREANFDGQRKVSKQHVEVLADMMKHSQWEPKDKLDFAEFDGRKYLINGYHRMHAQVRSGASVKWTVIVHPCKTWDDVKALYYKFDTNTRTRTAKQIINATDLAAEANLTNMMMNAVFGAVPVLANNFSSRMSDKDILTAKVIDRRLEFVRPYLRAAEHYQACLDGVPSGFKRKFYNAGVCAVALATLRFQSVKAQEFWSGAASNNGLFQGDPRLTFFNYLNANVTRPGGNKITTAFAPAIAWNAFFEDRDLKIIRITTGTQVHIAGTPWERD